MGRRDEKVAKAKKPFFKKWWFWLIVVIIVFAAATSGKTKNETSGTSQTKNATTATKSSKEEKQATATTFQEIVEAYKANGKSADDKYKGKLLEFSGTVSKITAGSFGGSDITIDAGNFTDNEFQTTSATVNIKDDNVAKELATGQSYTFVAKGNGAIVLDGGWVSNLTFKDGNVK